MCVAAITTCSDASSMHSDSSLSPDVVSGLLSEQERTLHQVRPDAHSLPCDRTGVFQGCLTGGASSVALHLTSFMEDTLRRRPSSLSTTHRRILCASKSRFLGGAEPIHTVSHSSECRASSCWWTASPSSERSSSRCQRFAKAFRGIQLEKVLNLAPKEIQLTQDLMRLFTEYQIPKDLMSFDGSDSASASERLEAVRRHV
jgi:hypothetical protein